MKNLVSQRFRKLVVLEPTSKREHGNIVWKCQCDCGNITFASTSSLNSGDKKSCGCLKFSNLTGRKFGKLVALGMTDKRQDGHIVWKCQCDCGNIAFVGASSLKSGNTKSCGCIIKNDMLGQRFGKLVAIEPTEERRGSSVVWKCQCDCGNIAFVGASSLKRGNTKSCGCLQKRLVSERGKVDIGGHRFGKLVALEPTEERQYNAVVWKCQCDCGNIAFINTGSLKSGNTKSCGCLRKIR